MSAMGRQLPLDLGARPAMDRASFLVSDANRDALAMVDDWARWPGGKLALAGAAGTGKSHLAGLWAAEVGATTLPATALGEGIEAARLAVEDVHRIAGDPVAEERLFHIHNAVLARGGRLLLTGRGLPSAWGIALPDLASRIAAAGVVRLTPPDDALLAGVLVKLFADRHIRPKPGLIDWLLPRIDRSFAGAETVVARLNTKALEHGRTVGVRLAAEVLAFD